MIFRDILLVGLGGFIGSALRYIIFYVTPIVPFNFPLGTFIVNVLGCFLIGIISQISLRYQGSFPSINLLLSVGLCGGFTTFSTFTKENVLLIQSGHYAQCAIYVSLSVILGIISFLLGMKFFS